MQSTLQKTIIEFPAKVIAQAGLSDLPASRRQVLRENLQNILLSRLVNALLAYLDEDRREQFAVEMESVDSMEDFFIALFQEVPNSDAIIIEETEILLEELTANG